MEGAYKIIEVIGSSEQSWEDAAKNAIKAASKSLKDLRIAEVAEMDMKIEDGEIISYRTKLKISFKVID
jgi:dodecin